MLKLHSNDESADWSLEVNSLYSKHSAVVLVTTHGNSLSFVLPLVSLL